MTTTATPKYRTRPRRELRADIEKKIAEYRAKLPLATTEDEHTAMTEKIEFLQQQIADLYSDVPQYEKPDQPALRTKDEMRRDLTDQREYVETAADLTNNERAARLRFLDGQLASIAEN